MRIGNSWQVSSPNSEFGYESGNNIIVYKSNPFQLIGGRTRLWLCNVISRLYRNIVFLHTWQVTGHMGVVCDRYSCSGHSGSITACVKIRKVNMICYNKVCWGQTYARRQQGPRGRRKRKRRRFWPLLRSVLSSWTAKRNLQLY